MYSGIRKIYSRYWRAYGGKEALKKSPYLHASIIILVITSHFWYNQEWWDQPLSVIPNLLGFSLGGLAMFLSFGNEKFRDFLSDSADKNTPSLYVELCASFVHFILLQIIALIIAITAKSLDFSFNWPQIIETPIFITTKIFHALGYLTFIYSIFSAAAATMTIFRTCTWYEIHHNSNKQHSPCPSVQDSNKENEEK